MLILILATLTALSSAKTYAQTSLPLFENSPNEGSELVKVTRFRVLVFPHLGAYSTPQGKEQSAASVVVNSGAQCVAYAAKLDSNQEWQKSGDAISSSSEMIFNQSKFKKLVAQYGSTTFYYECPSSFTVRRNAPLKSFNYSGDFIASVDEKGVQIVNLIDPEIYIKGVVPSEVIASWPAEVLKAQAVAARTYAWWSVVNARKLISMYDMDDTVQYQAYLGNSTRTADTDSAVDQTEKQILKYQDKVIKAYFSADSGGYTESARSAFGEDIPYCQAKPEQYDLTLTKTDWTKVITKEALQTALINRGLLPAKTLIKQAGVEEKNRNASGRVDQVSVVASNGKTFLILGSKFRYATGLRSTFFQVQMNGANFVFSGRGFGHGVGMAQIGALEYTRQFGWNYENILKFYYTDTELSTQNTAEPTAE